MGRVVKYFLYLVALGVIGLVGYALISDLQPPTEKLVVPVSPPAQ